MSETDKMQVDATEMDKNIAGELKAAQVQFFQHEMKKMQDEMSKL